MDFTNVCEGRRSIKKFDSNHAISDTELSAMFEQVRLTPSSFNLQHWRFVVVRDKDKKAALRGAAYNQEQVENASAVVVVLGKLNAHEDAERLYADAPQSVQDSMVPMIASFYTDKPTMQRDEAIRSASMAALTLMYAAHNAGYATGPMIGFDPEAVGKLIEIDNDHIPVMLIVLGRQVGDIRDRPFRYSVSEIVHENTLHGTGLD